jgi:putative redox protein
LISDTTIPGASRHLSTNAASTLRCRSMTCHAGSYLARHGLPAEGLTVEGEFTMAADAPAHVAEMSVSITPPAVLPDPRAAALLAVTSHCAVHNTLRQAPTVSIRLALPATTVD